MPSFQPTLELLPFAEDGFIPVPSVADILGISIRTMNRAIRRGAFPGEIVRRGRGQGGERYLHRSQIEAALLANLIPSPRIKRPAPSKQ
ncbi:helix-turn-helix domain-containing protein [Azospirillum oryzae]|uniref:Helix-turn-helix domain-containing protein n=1 Tax=Azospirillum oryzae TaxID=286727 RepID=A0A6N1AML1_9PROT|nr:helix-turn-helix domain-containing protein [Azospirillum oryzae]QKS52921.1 helix-turn-helix domain-containing protein [Azospirillum oryzae]